MKTDLLQYIEQKSLFKENEKIIVALSGGVDSMVLFDILYKLNKNIIIAHINHKVRSESDSEFQNIKAFAKERSVPFEGFVIEAKSNDNFHHFSRNQRYEFFKAIAQKYSVSKVFLAHHQDDQVETILMRLVRGTSFTGYAGIPTERHDRNLTILRPFMNVNKQDILDYAASHNIEYYEDESNQMDYYTRNRFRNKIIPLLKEENPKFSEHISQFADYVSSADIVLTRLKDEFIKEHCFYNTVNIEPFKLLDRAIMIKVIKHLVNKATNDSVEVQFEQYNNIINLVLNDTTNASYSIGKGYDFIKEYDCIYVKKETPFVKINIMIDKEGEYFVDDNKSYIFSHKKLEHNYSNKFELCYNDKVFPIYLRQRKNGDKMKLKIGTKKVKDIFIDQKVPLSKRDRVILLSTATHVLWIPGIKKSHQVDKQKKLYIYEVK